MPRKKTEPRTKPTKKPRKKNAVRMTRGQRIAEVAKVDKLIATGLGKQAACDKAGVNQANYYRWRNPPKKQYGNNKPAKAKPDALTVMRAPSNIDHAFSALSNAMLNAMTTDEIFAELRRRLEA